MTVSHDWASTKPFSTNSVCKSANLCCDIMKVWLDSHSVHDFQKEYMICVCCYSKPSKLIQWMVAFNQHHDAVWLLMHSYSTDLPGNTGRGDPKNELDRNTRRVLITCWIRQVKCLQNLASVWTLNHSSLSSVMNVVKSPLLAWLNFHAVNNGERL